MRARFRRAPVLLVLAAVAGPVLGCGRPGPEPVFRTSPPPVDAADPQAPTGGRNASQWLGAPYVVMVSLDGFAARYVDQYAPPTLTALTERGVWAREGMIPVYPPKTFPNHYSLATGMHPAHHGLVANTFYDPARDATYRISDREKVEDGSWYGGEPLWVTAERQGMVAASFYWVGSEADVDGVRPSHWRVFDDEVPNEDRVDQVLTWLSYPPEARPHLVTLYFSDTDHAGHDFGPESPELAAAVASVDRDLQRLVDGLQSLDHADQVTLMVMSDHGMDGFLPETTAYIGDVVPDLTGIRMPESGPTGNLWIEGGVERALAVRDAINDGLEHVTAYLPDETPAALEYRGHPRMGHLVVVPDSGWVVRLSNDRPARAGFTHGWDNRNLAMRALFVATGPRLESGARVAPFSSVDVYPLVAEILGIAPFPEIDGTLDPWRGVLRADPAR